jgi:LuxR family maltose regulon positive regulatory protein
MDTIDADRIYDSSHLSRPRIDAVFADANPIVAVCAGAGYGKTRAVSDFLRKQEMPSFLMQLDLHDNSVGNFWETYTGTLMLYDPVAGKKCRELGFPDTPEKTEMYLKIRNGALAGSAVILALDDFHIIENPSVLQFVKNCMIDGLPPGIKIILVCRDLTNINIETFLLNRSFSEVTESDLNFNENELTEYLRRQELPADIRTVREIHKDTEGWPFAVNLASRSLKKNPNYFGYVKTALRQNIYRLMESDNWDAVSGELRKLLAKISLTDHFPIELAATLAGGNDGLLRELSKQTAYIRFDNYGGAYIIHRMFLDFLRTKQDTLTDGEITGAYRAAAEWCSQNSFKADALSYYEKIKDYGAVVSVLSSLPILIPHDIALYAKGIFDRAPAEAFDNVPHFAEMHTGVVSCLGDVQDFYALTGFYERKFLALPEDDPMRSGSLFGIYLALGMARSAYAYDGIYDFDVYFSKMFDCITQEDFDSLPPLDCPRAPWINLTYSSEKGAPQKYIEAVMRSDNTAARFSDGVTTGTDSLIQCELLYYRGKVQAAKPFAARAIENAKKRMAYDTLHRARFYLMKIAVADGDLKTAKAALRDIENMLGEKSYPQRFTSYDISYGWFHHILRRPQKFPQWLTGKFSPCSHVFSAENFGNQIRARYCYLTRNFLPLLTYIREMKQKESFLLGRVEMLALEACVHYQMKNKPAAWTALKEAYEAASPNDILMPFIELGKDMRTLAAAVLREPSGTDIPPLWLESVKNKATSYAKSQSMFIAQYTSYNSGGKLLSAREQEVLRDLYHGFSQSEIALKQNLSVNTVKMVTKSIYEKLNVHKISDLTRIAAEQGLV